jgi:4-hydroxy-3-methylbut-2-enyl diphosphate reductase
VVIVVGSPNSSNSRRLKEVALALGIDGYLIDGPEEIDPACLRAKQHIGVTAGASAPEILVQRVVDRIR